MANTPTTSHGGSPAPASQRNCPSMSPTQLRAYLIARETLRRLKAAPTPSVPPDLSMRLSARAPTQSLSTR
jgi:hypothetical protein